MEPRKIVGIMTVKNEDVYVERALRNMLAFCDRVIIAENYSQDRTYEILSACAAREPKIELHRFEKFQEGHSLIEEFVGTDTWMFGVDGDEIYDPVGLAAMRPRVLAGEFQEQWCLFGNVVHCIALDSKQHVAKGYLAPPSRSMTKLYNFSIITEWTNCSERLHSGTLRFKEGYSEKLRYGIGNEYSWENSPFRCLHMVFLQRSSAASWRTGSRFNPAELMEQQKSRIKLGWWGRFLLAVNWQSRLLFHKDWKSQHYRRGALMEKSVEVFFPE